MDIKETIDLIEKYREFEKILETFARDYFWSYIQYVDESKARYVHYLESVRISSTNNSIIINYSGPGDYEDYVAVPLEYLFCDNYKDHKIDRLKSNAKLLDEAIERKEREQREKELKELKRLKQKYGRTE